MPYERTVTILYCVDVKNLELGTKLQQNCGYKGLAGKCKSIKTLLTFSVFDYHCYCHVLHQSSYLCLVFLIPDKNVIQ